MNDNNFDPTAANILSSLRIKGATVQGGSDREGFVPVLGPGGTLDASVVPLQEIQTQIHIPPLGRTAYVDSRSTAVSPDGSIASPFKTLTDAAASSSHFSNFILASGSYGAEDVTFSTEEGVVRIFTTGSAAFGALSLQGYSGGATIWLDNVSATTLVFKVDVQRQLILTGRGQIGAIANSEEEPYQPITVFMDPDYSVGDTGPASTVVYMAKSSQVENTSAEVPGETITDAVDTLGRRIIRIPIFTSDADGVKVSGTEDEAVRYADSDDSSSAPDNMYVLTRIGITLAEAVNGVFHKDGDSPTYNEVTVEGGITARDALVTEIGTNQVNFRVGNVTKAVLTLDNDGFLVVNS